MHCWCPPATGPGQPHLSGCSHFKRLPPVKAHIASYHDWDLTGPDEPPEPEYDAPHDKNYWASGKLAGSPFDYQAYEEYTQLAYKHALQWLETQKSQSYAHLIEPVAPVAPPGPAPIFVVKIPSFIVEPASIEINELGSELDGGPDAPDVEFCTCTCAAVSGVIGHAQFCPLGSGAGE
jgi:hypothetical protein